MDGDRDERLSAELELIQSMYPDQIKYDAKARDVIFHNGEGSFVVRLPAGYLLDALPEVISSSTGKSDSREALRQRIATLEVGEEALDSVVLAFEELVEAATSETEIGTVDRDRENRASESSSDGHATIVVWLHHLLNTNKRKQALSPPSPDVSGITKPGYPGVLLYSGPAKAVHEHVNELKQLNWAAFQVRLEDNEEWHFVHGQGVKEVEAMKDIVAEVGEERRQVFLEAMRIK